MSFDVVVLGASGTYPTPLSAATGFLLRSEGSNVWVDAGTGTFANLQRHMDFFDLDAIVLSHLHLDHFLDVYPLYYAIRHSPRSKGPMGLKVFAPFGTAKHLAKLPGSINRESFDGYFEFHPIVDGDKLTIGPFEFEFVRSRHPIETLAMRVESGGRTLFYTADTATSDAVTQLASGADLLIAEASFQEPPKAQGIHMTGEEAGEMATMAKVGRLVLTHVIPGLDPAISLKQAASRFDGEVSLATDNAVFVV